MWSGRFNRLAHCYCSGSALAASGNIAEALVERYRVGTRPEYDELVASSRSLVLG